MLGGQSKTCGHYADHRISVAIQLNRAANRMRIAAQKVSPETVADHGQTRRASHILLGRNNPSQRCLRAERLQKTHVDEPDPDLYRLSCANVIHGLHVYAA